MDFSVQSLEGLGQAERIRLCRQLRRKQVENYLEFVSRELASQADPPRPLPRKPNSRGTQAHFHGDVCLQTAVEETDEREVIDYLHSGSDCNFSTGNGTTLLHKCCAEGNFSTAELLLLKGANVNCKDDDWWTPLHVACYQDNADIVHLLLMNEADVSSMDVDGNFPIDHAPQQTDTWDTLVTSMETKGLSEKNLKKLRQERCRQMEEDVRQMVRTSQDVNGVRSDDGVMLLHMAAANGYVKCGKLLLKHGADVNSLTASSGWTPLHCAAKFGQAKMAELLIEFGADVSLTDKGGQRPIDLAAGEDIQKLFLEARAAARKSALLAEGKDDTATDDDEDITSTKIVRPSHLPLSKADRLMEGQMMLQARSLPPLPPPSSHQPSTRNGRRKERVGRRGGNDDVGDDDDEDESNYEEIFATTIYNTAETEQGQLPARSPQDDLSSLPSLTERIILETVLQRYDDKTIYTNMGDVLLAVNPFTDLPIYGQWGLALGAMRLGKLLRFARAEPQQLSPPATTTSLGQTEASKIYREATAMPSLPPHVYAVAEHAQRASRSSGASQCCVISGESGAGKTETCKLLVQHLMCSASASEHQLNSKLHQINPLLEAFGNAQTVMNSNSSRFAKYLELVFAPDGCVLGGHLHQYLLEKSRVVHQGPKEGNFHIFSWLLNGATPEEKAQCMLDRNAYRCLQTGGPGTGGSTAQQKLLEMKDCMKFVGFSHDDITNMLTTVAAVLHLGDVTFRERAEGQPMTPAQPVILKKVCSLLRLPYEDLVSALTEDVLTARGEELCRPLTQGQCRDSVDAVSKAVYSRLFAWIVNGINQMVAPLDDYKGEKLSIGVLDIFGFENLHSNGFEQMCINVANERLQQYYQRQVFEEERQQCVSEGVPPVDVVFPCSQHVVQLFMEKNTGVYDLLDEESMFPKASDDTLATKLHNYPGKKYESVYKTPRYGGTTFTVVHYAGAVQYSLGGVLEKNRDTLRNALAFVMRSSESLLVKELFQAGVTKTGSISPSARQRVSRKIKPSKSPFDFFKKLRKSKQDHRGQKKNANAPSGTATSRKCPSTLTFHFKNSLREMLSKLELSAPHFIRCLKPNPSGRPLQADSEYLSAQLRYSGVLQTAVLRKEGYAVRSPFEHFVHSYPALALFYDGGKASADVESRAHHVMTSFHIPRDQAGRSKVFLRLHQVQHLHIEDARLTARVVTAQAAIRRFLARRFVQKRRRAREEYRRQVALQAEMERQEAERRRAAGEEEEKQRRLAEEEKRKAEEEEGEKMEDVSEEEVVIRRPHPQQNLSGVEKDVRQSLDMLDSVLSQYTQGQLDTSFDSVDRIDDQLRGEDDVYRDASSAYIAALPTTTTREDNDDDDNSDDNASDDGYQDALSLSSEQLTAPSSSDMPRPKKAPHPCSQPQVPPIYQQQLLQQQQQLQQQHQQQQQQQYPYHPQDLPMMDPSGRTSFLPSPREMYSPQMGFNQSALNGHPGGGMCGKRVPPQVPERSPDTHLSTGRDSSRKSSVSSKDSCSSLDHLSEMNEVFEGSPQHHHTQHHHHDPHTPTTRYPDTRPFSYAAGVDPKTLQQQRHCAGVSTNGGCGPKGRAVSEAYPGGDGGGYYDPAGRGYPPYSDGRRAGSNTPSTSSSQGSVNGMGTGPSHQDVVANAAHGGRSQGHHHGYDSAPPQGAPWSPSQTVAGGCGGYVYPPSPGHAQPPPPPPPAAQTYGGGGGPPRVPQAGPGGGVVAAAAAAAAAMGGSVGGSPRHVHTHHHIVTKPHPSPPASRRGSSGGSPGRSRSPGPPPSAFQPVPASSSSSASAQPAPSSSSVPPPPSFPAPPPPLPLHDRYLAATQETRSPSPPLPPPPPNEVGVASRSAAARPSVPGVQPPSSRALPTSAAPPLGIPGGLRGEHQSRGEDQRGVAGQSPARGPGAGPSKLRRAESLENNGTGQQQQPTESPLAVRLKPTAGKFSHIYQEQSPTEVVPEELPPPPLPDQEELPPPPPHQPTSTLPPDAASASASAPPAALASPSGGGGLAESHLAAAVSRMEIEIPDDIDLSQCPGLVEITGATPNWKKEMIDKKNKDKIEEYVKHVLGRREQEAKWRNVPEWKRALLMKKDQEKHVLGRREQEAKWRNVPEWKRALLMKKDQEDAEAAMSSPPDRKMGGGSPAAPKEAPPPPMPKPKGDIVPAALSMDPAELESMPPWKRELLFKREKVPITFSNEFNPDEEEEQQEEPNQS